MEHEYGNRWLSDKICNINGGSGGGGGGRGEVYFLYAGVGGGGWGGGTGQGSFLNFTSDIGSPWTHPGPHVLMQGGLLVVSCIRMGVVE